MICNNCGTEYKGRNRKGRKSPQSSFCSKECYWKSMTILLTCNTCGIEFKRTSNGVLKYCSKECRSNDVEARKKNSEWHKKLPKEHYSKMGILSVSSQGKGRESSIEKKLYDYLILKGILFEKQYVVNGKFVVDAYIPSLNLVIEADGSYWHSLPQNIKRDKSKDAYLTKCGYDRVRLPEEEIKNNEFIQILERRLI